MASEIFLTKSQNNSFSPADELSLEVASKIKFGSTVKANIVQPRNIQFHRKYFALIGLGYEYWNPPEQEWQGIKAEKSPQVFREQVIIQAGFREVTYNLDGSVKVIAKSMSFGSMDDITFGLLYSSSFKVIWALVLSKCEGWTVKEMENVLANLESFT